MTTSHNMPRILALSARLLKEYDEPEKFLAWIETNGPAILPELAALTRTGHESKAFFHMLGIQIYNHMPLEKTTSSCPPFPGLLPTPSATAARV